MNKLLKYTLLRSKIVFKNIPLILTGSVMLIVISSLLAYIVYNANFKDNKNKIKVALIGNTEESYLGFGIEAVRNFDNSRNNIEFIEVSNEEAARNMLIKKEIVGYAVIPDDFVSSLGRGENKEIKYVSNYLDDSAESVLIKEITDLISVILINSEKAIYGVTDFVEAENIKRLEFDYVKDMNLSLLSAVFARDSIYEVETRDYSKGISWIQYYFISLNLFIILIICMQAGVFIGTKDDGLCKILISRDYSISCIVLGEYLAYMLAIFLLTALVYIVEFLILHNLSSQGLGYEISRYMGLYFWGSIPVIFLFSCMYFMLGEVGGSFNNYILGFIVLIFFAYASGYFYPKELLPKMVENISGFLPTDLAFKYMKDIIKYSYSDENIKIYLTSLIFLLTSICIRKVRIKNV